MRPRYLFICTVLAFFCSLPVHAEDVRIKIAVMELQALSGYEQGEAAQLTELLKADLINNTRFFVVEQDALQAGAAERFAGCTEIDCALEIGRLLETEYVLVGTVGKIGGDTAFSISLVNVLSEERVLAEDYVVAGDRVIDEIHAIARQVTNSAVLITRVDIDDIKGYIRREQFDKAKRYLNFYIEKNGRGEDEVKQLETVINKRLSEIRYRQAREMLDNYLFAEAKTLIEEALLLDPDNLMYIDLKERIEVEESAQTEMDRAQLIGEIEKYLEQKDYKTANTLMLILVRQYPAEKRNYNRHYRG
jgi:TolB-like protein